MDAIGQGRLLFRKHQDHKVSLSECDQNQLEADIKRFIYIGIKEITPAVKLFVFGQILDVLTRVLRMRALENMDIGPVTKAFENLELYFVLLVEQPWKPEFKKLKMYGGFYKTKIRSVLLEPEPIFRLAGYELDKDRHLLVIKKPVQKDTLLSIAFDCRVASSLCRTIMQHYNRLKSLNKTLGDAISDILQDSSFSSLVPRNPTSANILKGSGIVRPPAIPKREPQVNGSPDIKRPLSISERIPHSVSDISVWRPADSVKVKSPSKSAVQDPLLFNLPQHPLNTGARMAPTMTSAEADDHLLCIGDSNTEILPVLPEGTSEDHMRESLKMVGKQRSSRHLEGTASEPNSAIVPTYEDLAWYDQPNLHVEGFSRYSALTYPPGLSHSHIRVPVACLGANPASIDEGIGSEMSTVLKPSTRYYSSGQSQVILPNKAPSSVPQSSMIDYGYRSENIVHPTTNPGWSQNIYVPPEVDPDSDPLKLGIQMRSGSPVVRRAPPIPPRELKPSYQLSERIQGEDTVDGPLLGTTTAVEAVANVNHNGPSIRPTRSLQVQVNGKISSDHGGGSSQVYSDFADESNVRRSRISSAGRSGSLKTGESKSPLAQVAAQSRVTRSMDFTHTRWECQTCTTRNVASSNVCSMCSRSRNGQEDLEPATGESRIPCEVCTYENTVDKTHCDMCNSELKGPRFTHI